MTSLNRNIPSITGALIKFGLKGYFLIAALAIIGVSCASKEEELFYPADENKLSLRVSPTNVTLPAFEATQELSVESNSRWTIKDPDDNSWLRLRFTSEPAGTASGTFEISVDNNLSRESRHATVIVTGSSKEEIVNVTQTGMVVYVTPTEMSVPAEGGDVSFSVRSSSPWVIEFDEKWLSLDRTEGTGTGDAEEVTATVGSNMIGSKDRTANLFIKSPNSQFDEIKVVITQLSNSLPIAYVTPTTLSAKAEGENLSIAIRCFLPWQIRCLEPWVHINKTSGEGTGESETIGISVESNMTSTTSRTATIFVESPNSQFDAMSVKIEQRASSIPILQTPVLIERGKTTASISCEYFSESPIVEKGIYLSTNSDLNEGNSRMVLDIGYNVGKIFVTLNGLEQDNEYYVRAFVATANKRILTPPINFRTLGRRPDSGDNPTPQ